MKPYEALPDAVEWQGEQIRIDYSYAAVLAALDVLTDERMPPALQLRTALEILVIDEDYPEDPELLREIIRTAGFDQEPETHEPKVMDMEQDWPLIAAGFQQAYGIDLYADKTMHVVRFRALLQGLPKGTRIMDVVGIRAAEMPAPNKHNARQIAELSRLKARYALRGSEADIQRGLARMFELLEERAKK